MLCTECPRLYNSDLIFVVPSIMLYSSEISPTRCNNFILRNGFTLHVSGDNSTHHQEYNTQHSEKQHCITRQCYLQLNTTDNDKTTRILTKLQHKYTCLPERPYTAYVLLMMGGIVTRNM